MANQVFLNFINANFDLVSSDILPLIENEYLRVGVTEVVERAKATVIAFAEGNFTKEGLVAIWENLPSDPDVIATIKQILSDLINKIDEIEVREGLQLLVEPIMKSIVVLVDKQDSNKELLGQIWKEFVNSPELLVYALGHLEWIIKRFIKDDSAVKWIMKLINAFTSK